MPAFDHKTQSPEFRLLLSCLQSAVYGNELLTPSVSTEGVNWDEFFKLALIHKVAPLVWHGLKIQTGIKLSNRLTQQFETTLINHSRKAMLDTVEHVNIIRRLLQAGIELVPLKGSTLALRAYSSLADRHAGDIDLLLINQQDIWKADELVLKMDYKRIHPEFDLSTRQKEAYLNLENDLVYVHEQTGVKLELHFDWSKNPLLFPLDLQQIKNKGQTITMANHSIDCLDDVDHLHYLFVHGAKHAWFRLKWLCDIPLMIRQLSSTQIEQLFEDAKRLGTLRMVLQGIELSRAFLNMPVPAQIKQSNQSQLKYLTKRASEAIIDTDKLNNKQLSSGKKFLRLLSDLHYALVLRSEVSYKFKHLSLYLTNSSDWNAVKIPDKAFNLYHLLRPFIWIFRQLKR